LHTYTFYANLQFDCKKTMEKNHNNFIMITINLHIILWKNGMTCNYVFELQWPFVTQHISMSINGIKQVAWVVIDAPHRMWNQYAIYAT